MESAESEVAILQVDRHQHFKLKLSGKAEQMSSISRYQPPKNIDAPHPHITAAREAGDAWCNPTGSKPTAAAAAVAAAAAALVHLWNMYCKTVLGVAVEPGAAARYVASLLQAAAVKVFVG